MKKLTKFEKFNITESSEESGNDGFKELYRGKFPSYNKAWEKADEIYVEKNQEIESCEVEGPFDTDKETDKWIMSFDENVFESVTDNIIKGNEITSDFNADEESKNLFGFAGVKNATIKKIGSFTSFTKMINPPTPKERTVLNAGQFIDNDIVQGYVNRVEGGKVFIEPLETPGEIIEVSLKDAIKIKKEQKNHTATLKIKESNK